MQQLNFLCLSTQELTDLIDKSIKRTLEEQPIQIVQPFKEDLLDIHQVAELLHTTTQNIHAKKRKGQIPFLRFGGRILFKRSEVIDSLKSIKIAR